MAVDTRTGASTRMPDGTRRMWHSNDAECVRADCPEYHVTKAELLAVDPDDALAVGFAAGKDRAKGESS